MHLACSGASAFYGLLGRYTGVEPTAGNVRDRWCNVRSGPLDPGPPPGACITPQVDQAKEIVGHREIDAVYVSIGGNDAHFADIVVVEVRGAGQAVGAQPHVVVEVRRNSPRR